MTIDRRSLLKASLGGLAGLVSVPLLGATSPRLSSQLLAGKVTLISGAPGNVLALATDEGVVLVDSGAADHARALKSSLGSAKVPVLFNTHYHADQTGGNALFGAAGAAIMPTSSPASGSRRTTTCRRKTTG